jgi:hypothetical protein
MLSALAIVSLAAGWSLSETLRYLGLVLQLVGFGATGWGLVDLRRRFTDQPSLLAVVRARLGRALARRLLSLAGYSAGHRR